MTNGAPNTRSLGSGLVLDDGALTGEGGWGEKEGSAEGSALGEEVTGEE